MFEKVSKHTVLKEVRDKGVFEGYISPSKVSPEHLVGGWGLGMFVKIKQIGDNYILVKESGNYPLELYLHMFKMSNCNSELGYRVRFWREVT